MISEVIFAKYQFGAIQRILQTVKSRNGGMFHRFRDILRITSYTTRSGHLKLIYVGPSDFK